MARGRFISNRLGGSKKFSRLANDSHRLAYVLLVTMTDVEGRVEADPPLLKGYAYTLLDWSHAQVQTALEDMHNVGLIHLYQIDGEQYAQVTDFEKHNKVRKDRESNSGIPGPMDNSGSTPGQLREYAGSTPPQVEVQVEVKGEGEGEGQDPPPETSEDRFHTRLNGGSSANQTHRVRTTIRRLNPDFAKRHEDHMPTWAKWTDQDIHRLWDASHPDKWPDGNKKRRSWIFKDLLDEERTAPIVIEDKGDWLERTLKDQGIYDLVMENP